MTLRRSVLCFVVALTLAGCAAPAGTAPGAPTGSPAEATPTDEPVGSDSATPSPLAGTGVCDPASLYAEIISWDSGAGHRTATVQLTNIGAVDCKVRSLAKPQLVGGDGTILIDGKDPASSTLITLHPNDVVTTLVDNDNYCGPTPTAPVTVAFVFPSGEGRVVANPVSPTDVDGVPPCTGAGSPGVIEMHPWAP